MNWQLFPPRLDPLRARAQALDGQRPKRLNGPIFRRPDIQPGRATILRKGRRLRDNITRRDGETGERGLLEAFHLQIIGAALGSGK